MGRNQLTWSPHTFLQGVDTHQQNPSSQTDAKSLRLGRHQPFILSWIGGCPTPLAELRCLLTQSPVSVPWLYNQQNQLTLTESHTGPPTLLQTLLTWRSQLSSLTCLSSTKPHLLGLFAYTLVLVTLVLLSDIHSAVCLCACPATKASVVVFFVKSIHENFVHFKCWGPCSAPSFLSLTAGYGHLSRHGPLWQ